MREQILQTATVQFVERGYDGVSMREIAEACGITKAALYYHFTGKAELLAQIFTDYLDQMAEVVEAGRARPGSVEERIRWVIGRIFEMPVEQRAIIRLARHDVVRLNSDDRQSFGTAYSERFLRPLADLLAQGSASGELREIDPSWALWVLLGMIYPFLTPPAAAADPRAVSELLDVFFHGTKR
jgi:AcrR family transcriptional regulator